MLNLPTTAILGIVKGLGAALSKLFLGLFLIRTGENKEVLKGSKKEVKDAKEANKVNNHIANLDDDVLNDGLLANKSKPKRRR